MKAVVLVATRDSRPLPAGGTRGSEEVSGAKLATRSTPFLSRERPTVGVGGVGGENVVLKDREAIQTGV